MAQLIVRKLPSLIVRALKLRAAAQGRSAEAEHREILRSVLTPSNPGQSLKAALLRMPDVGMEEDFSRPTDYGREPPL